MADMTPTQGTTPAPTGANLPPPPLPGVGVVQPPPRVWLPRAMPFSEVGAFLDWLAGAHPEVLDAWVKASAAKTVKLPATA